MSSKQSAAISPLMKQVSGYIAGALRKPLPKPVVEKTKQHILDTFAAMVSGAGLRLERSTDPPVRSIEK